MELFLANVLTIKGFAGSPTVYVPQVLMADGALQWSGNHMFDELNAVKTAAAMAKSYNEA